MPAEMASPRNAPKRRGSMKQMDEDAYPPVSLLGMSTDEAADLIWSRLKTLAKLEGNLRAHDVS